MRPSELRALATKVAWAYIGKPYKWGGDDPMQGFDCSGLVCEILQSVGRIGRKEDLTADGLRLRFEVQLVNGPPSEGCLALWLNDAGRAVHVEYCIDALHTIGASGGDSTTVDEAAAIRMNAFIKVRPWQTRGGRVMFVDPFPVEAP